jgi:ribonuclease P protein component
MPIPVERYTFRKLEKICNQKQINTLFNEGKTLKSGFFRLLYVETKAQGTPVVQILIAVPKNKLRHAVTRNRMKRLIREAYRLNKHKIIEAYTKTGKHCDIAFVFMGNKCVSLSETSAAIIELLDRLILTHEKDTE